MYYFNREIKIYYNVVGEGKPLLIIHGFSIDHRGVKGTVEESLKLQKYKRIYIDLPGMGKSPAPDKIINADELLYHLLKFITTVIGKESFSILGYSYGGYLALGLVKMIPNRVENLVLLAPVVKAISEHRQLPLEPKKNVQHFDVENKILFEQYKANVVNVNEKGYENYIAEIHSGLSAGDPVFQKTFQKTGYVFKAEKSLFDRNINCQSLIILGQKDVVVGFKDMLAKQNKFSKASFVLLENAGHNIQLDEREQVVKKIRSFFEEYEDSF